MSVLCATCGKPIPPDDINVAKDVAFCRACNRATTLSALVAGAERGASVDPKSPPPGAWFRDDGGQSVVGASTRSPLAFFIVPFMCVWSGFSLGGIYGTQIASGKLDAAMCLFGIPFLIGSVVLLAAALMTIAGKVEVTVRGDDGEIFTGVGSLGWRRRFRCSEFSRVSEGYAGWSSNRRPMLGIVLEGSRRLTFGSGLNEARRYFIMEVMRALLGAAR